MRNKHPQSELKVRVSLIYIFSPVCYTMDVKGVSYSLLQYWPLQLPIMVISIPEHFQDQVPLSLKQAPHTRVLPCLVSPHHHLDQGWLASIPYHLEVNPCLQYRSTACHLWSDPSHPWLCVSRFPCKSYTNKDFRGKGHSSEGFMWIC